MTFLARCCRSYTHGLVLLFLMTLLMGCTSSRPVEAAVLDETSLLREQRLREQVSAWEGTPYRWGGLTREGIDCSGFVLITFGDLFGVTLPRSTREQVKLGASISLAEAQVGDLIFFRPRRRTQHVGIYLGNGEFAHASTSIGVTISRLDEPYWKKAYWTTRRLLSLSALETTQTDTSSSTFERRIGW